MTALEVSRWRIEPLDRKRRSVGDRIALRLPAVIRRLSAAVLRLPISSRLRGAMISLSFREGFAAANRGDYDRQYLQYDPRVEIEIEDPGWWTVDIEPVYRGIDGARKLIDELKVAFEMVRWDPQEVVDAGSGRVACRLEVVAVGRASGVETRRGQWHCYLIEGGLIMRQRIVTTEDEALAVLGGADEPLASPAR